MRGVVAVFVFAAVCACGGGGSSSGGGLVGPNAQEVNLVALAPGGLTPLGRIGVDNESGEAIVDLELRRAGAPFSVAPFEPEGGWIPDGSAWQMPFEMAEGFYDVRAVTESGRVIGGSFVFDSGVTDTWVAD